MKKYLLNFSALLITSCGVQMPLTTQPSENNDSYRVSYLFEHDGCKVYRFYDRGNYVYFTNCNGETIAKKDSLQIRNSTKILKK
jgi:hypothetical protein